MDHRLPKSDVRSDEIPSIGGTIGATKSHRQNPEIKLKFRVLIIGRANAGKTSILQRVCDTTDSPIVYLGEDENGEQVRGPTL